MYIFKYKRRFVYKKIKEVIGHSYDIDTDRMDVFKKDMVISIPKWSECQLELGSDFLLFEKQNINAEAGVSAGV